MVDQSKTKRKAPRMSSELERGLLALVEAFGNEQEAYQAFQISPVTYGNWKRRHPEFAEAVKGALEKNIRKTTQDFQAVAEEFRLATLEYRRKCLRGEHRVSHEDYEYNSEGKILRKTLSTPLAPSEQFLQKFDISPEQEEFRIVVDVTLPEEDYSFLTTQTEADL